MYYSVAVGIFIYFLMIAFFLRKKIIKYVYDPLLHSIILIWFSSFFAVPYLIYNEESRYSILAYSDNAVMQYILYCFVFFIIQVGIFVLFADKGWLVTSKDISEKVLSLKLVRRKLHLVVSAIMILPVTYAVFSIYSMVSSFGFGVYLANRIVLTSGAGYLFALLIFPSFAFLIYAVNRFMIFGVKKKYIYFGFLGITLASAPLLLSGSRSMLAMGWLMLISAIFIISAPRGWVYQRSIIFKAGIFIIGLLLIMSTLGSVRQSAMGESDLRSVDFSHNNGSKLHVGALEGFGTNENLLWFFDNEEKIHYLYGSSLVSVLVGPIPRAMWSQKPTGGGPILKNWIAPGSYDLSSGQNISSYTTGFLPEMYMNFGWFGVFFGPILLSIICLLFSKLILNIRSEIGLALWIVVGLRFLGLINAEFYGAWIHIFIALMFFSIYYFFIYLFKIKEVK